jgi:macrolide-specific efflux system membrane fusion protein
LTNLGSLQVKVGFTETDAAKVQIGQTADVTFDALTGVQLTGKVATLSPTSTTVNNVVTYYAEIALNGNDARVKPGMTSSVTVIIDQRDNVLVVPTNAVTGRGTTGTVTVVDAAGKQTITPVQIGLRGDSGVEITSGVTAGEKLFVRSAAATATGGTGTNARLGGGLGGGGGVFVGGGGGGGGRG